MGAKVRQGVPDLFAMVFKDGLQMIVVGLRLGIVAALPVRRLVVDILFGVTPSDPATFAERVCSVWHSPSLQNCNWRELTFCARLLNWQVRIRADDGNPEVSRTQLPRQSWKRAAGWPSLGQVHRPRHHSRALTIT